MKSNLILAILLFCFIISCSEEEPIEIPTPTPTPEEPSIKLRNDAALGNILTDETGKSLYFFSRDLDGNSACSGGCLNNWPIYFIENLKLSAGLNASDFGVILRADGARQTTYKGWPLYYFSADQANETKGESFNDIWFVAKTDYTVMMANGQLVGHDGVSYTSAYEPGEANTEYLVDGLGRTIYTFFRDQFNKNNFTRADFSNDAIWPLFSEDLKSIPSNLDQSDFDQIDVHGRKQVTYKGWPLYYFNQDESVRGNNKGISFPSPGAWPIANRALASAPLVPSVVLSDNATLGKILTDETGRTLYYFSRDIDGSSKCNGNCLTNWPIYYLEDLNVSDGLNKDYFSTITRADGSMQTSYKGWPLYYFLNDLTAGDTKGEAVNNIWFVAKPDYSVMISNGQLMGHDGQNYTGEYQLGNGNTEFLVDAEGKTLYAFVRDFFNVNNFTSSDFSNDAVWPIYSEELGAVPSNLNKDDFGTINVFGRNQLTYKGWPLYYFGGDENVRGSAKGVSFPAPGVWPIVNRAIAPAASVPVSYKDFIDPLLRSTCASASCHAGSSPAAGINLTLYNSVKEIADNGQLVGVTFWQAGFSRMPQGGAQLSQDRLDKIKSWVDAGAEKN